MGSTATTAVEGHSSSMRSSSAPHRGTRQARRLAIGMGAGLLLALCGTALAAPGDNVALGKPVTMSSDIGATAAACTDGDTNGNFTVAQGCQTTAAAAGANREWIEIDLGQNYVIERIVLWNRTDLAGTSNWILTTSRPAVLAGVLTAVPSSAFTNVGVNSLTYANGQAVGVPQGTGPGPNYSSLDLQAGTHTARYVRIYRLAASQALQLAEIQVIEGPPAVRTFTNSGFELPVIPASSFAQRTESVVPGWSTTETNTSPSPYSAGGNIEIWSNGFLGVAAPEGLQFAELNAFNPAALSQQPVCIYPAETFTISFRHRGRTGVDTAALLIDNVQWVTVADNNAAGGTHTCTVVSGPGCTQDPTQANGWTRYQTSYTNTSGGPQVVNLSYAAISAAGGLAAGNLMDDVRITGLVTAVEFSAATASGPENVPTANLPRLLVSGVVAAPQTVEIAITGGTAVRGVDYNTVPAAGNLVVNIPAGSYDGTLATAVSLASVIQILPDPDTPPGPETIEMELVNPSAGIAITGVSICGPAVADHTYEILQPPILSLVKQAPPAFVVGQPGAYTLLVTNLGATDTSGVITVTDTVPAGLTINSASGSGWSCNVVSQTVTCTTNQVLVANGGTAPAILISVTPQAATAGTQVANTASVSGGGDTQCPAAVNCNSGTSTPVNGPTLTLVKQGPPALVVGQPADYALQVSNTGTAPTSGLITVTDTVPVGLTIGSAGGSGWTCNVVSQTVTCTTPAVLAGNGGTAPVILINVTPQAATAGTQVSNTASASGGGDSSCPAASHCNGGVTTPVNEPALSLVKQGPAALIVGQPADYILLLTNTGTAATSGIITVSDPVPGGLTIGSASGSGWTCNVAGQTVTCTTPFVLVANGGAAPVITVNVTPDASANGQSMSNTATASGGGDAGCPGEPRCSGTFSGPVEAPALTLVKSGPSAFVVGQPASYVLQVTNAGTAPTSGLITVTDSVPAGLTLGSAGGLGWTCGIAGQTVTCTTNQVLVANGGQAPDIVIEVTAQASANGQQLANSATASGGGDPGCPGDPRCEGGVTVPVEAPALEITKQGPDAFVVGQAVDYTLQLTNQGSASTSGTITVVDAVPGGLSINLASGSGWTCNVAGQTVTCTTSQVLVANGGVAPVIIINVTPLPSADGQSLTNAASVSGGGDPGCPIEERCDASSTAPVQAPALTIVKQAPPALVVGQPADFTLEVTNNGTAATFDVITVTDTVPGGLSVNTATGSGWACAIVGQVVTCTTSQELAANGGVAPVITINVTPLPGANGQVLSNTATVGGGGDPGCPGAERCNDSTGSPVDAPALTITKQGPAALVVGQPADYVLQVTNTGTAATSGTITVTDPMPGGLAINTAGGPGWACGIAGQIVTCTTSQVLAANGGDATPITINVTPLLSAAGQSLSNSATVGGGGDPSCPGAERCSDSFGSPVDAPALSLVKQGPAELTVGQPADYTLVVTNLGTLATSGIITVTDPVPGGLTVNSAGGPGWSCAIGGQNVTCTTAQILAANGGASTPITINVTAQASAEGQVLANSASAQGGGDLACPAELRCTAEIAIPVGASSGVEIPTLSGWMLMSLALLLMVAGWWRLRAAGAQA